LVHSGDDPRPRMPRILFRHITADLLRIKLLTASVLVAVIAFGAAIRPIMQNLLGADDVLQYVALASVPMLQFALPFAGAFAGTIVYARLAADNEILAMAAAGLSYRRILMPAFGVGVMLFIVMAVLVDAGVPRFWTSMRMLITRDVTRLFVSSVEHGEALAIGGTQLYADGVVVTPGSPDGKGPATRLTLAGVAAIEIGSDGRPSTEFTAELATVDVYRENDSAYLKLLFKNATAYNSDEGTLVYVPQAEPQPIDLGKGIRLTPKDLDFSGLMHLWNNLDSYYAVSEPRTRTIAALGARDRWQCVERGLAAGALKLVDVDAHRAFEIRGARMEGDDRLVPRTGSTFELIELDRGGAGRRASVSEAILRQAVRAGSGEVAFELLASADHIVDTRGSTAGRWPPRINGLSPDGCGVRDRANDSVLQLAAEAAQFEPNAGEARAAKAAAVAKDSSQQMSNAIRLVRADIVARIVQRINQSLCGPLMILLGAVLAIRLRGSNPLQVYMLAFIPSIIEILLISGGEQMLRDGTSALGIFVATSGNIGIAVMIAIAYRRVARN